MNADLGIPHLAVELNRPRRSNIFSPLAMIRPHSPQRYAPCRPSVFQKQENRVSASSYLHMHDGSPGKIPRPRMAKASIRWHPPVPVADAVSAFSADKKISGTDRAPDVTLLDPRETYDTGPTSSAHPPVNGRDLLAEIGGQWSQEADFCFSDTGRGSCAEVRTVRTSRQANVLIWGLTFDFAEREHGATLGGVSPDTAPAVAREG